MNKINALEEINRIWNNREILLGDKINNISELFYSEGLDLSATAAYIKSTPSELDALLSLSELSQPILDRISKINPPKTTWMMLGNASEEEINQALEALEKGEYSTKSNCNNYTFSEFIYNKMIEVSEPKIEQKVLMITGEEFSHIRKKQTVLAN